MSIRTAFYGPFMSFLFVLANITFANAQNQGTPAAESGSENLLRSNGLIYVVVGVVLIILAGLILYLTSIDRKLSRLEKEIHNKG